MKLHRIVATVTATAALTGVWAGSASADTTTQESVSQNWAGYVAGDSSSGTQFSDVSGSWVQPAAKCGSGQTYSAFWVGLGGSGNQSSALEQTGTQADCNADGSTDYYAWYELVPSAPVRLGLTIQPGDHISAKVSVSGTNVTVSLSDQTSGQSTTKTLQMDSPDTSSAEWIAEAPSACDGSGSCQPLPLSDFGTVQFTSATATADGHTGTISDSNWTAQPVVLGSGGVSEVSFAADQSNAGAAPSSLSSDGSSFSVAYQQNAASASGSGTGGSSGGSGDYGYGGGYGYGGYPGADGGYGSGGYPGDGGGYGHGDPGGYGQYGYGGGGYGYGAF
jgi:peptidase A4-like protein